MKKTKLFKSLLVAAGLLVGASAWAKTYFTQDYEASDVTADWTTSTSGRHTPIIMEENGNHFLAADPTQTYNNGATLTGPSLGVPADIDFTLLFDLRIATTNSSAPTFTVQDASGSTFFKLTAKSTNNNKETSTVWIVNNNTEITLEGTQYKNSSTVSDRPWYRFKISQSVGVTYMTVTAVADNSVVFERGIITTLTNAKGLGKMIQATNKNLGKFAIDNIVARDIEDGDVPASTATTYTIKYVDGNNQTLQEDVVLNSIVNIEVTASAEQMNAIVKDEKRYIYQSGNTPITTVVDAASNVITLVYREAEKWSWTATAKYDGTALDYTQSGEVWEDQNTIKIAYPRFLAVGTQLVAKAPISNELRQSATITENNFAIDIEYTAVEGVDNLYLLSEAENLGTNIATASTSFSGRVSNGLIIHAEEGTLLKLPTGKYIFTLGVIGGATTSHEVSYVVKAGETTIAQGICTNNFLNLYTGEEFTLTAFSTPITFTCSDHSSDRGIDLIYIQKTSTPAEDKALRVFSITGLGGDWDTELDMTQSSVEGEEDIYTATTTITVTNNTYSTPYKLHQDHAWSAYQLPSDESNYTWTPTEGIGIYTLTFRADVANHSLTVEAEKEDFTYAVVGCTYDGETEVQSALFSGSKVWDTANSTDLMTKQADGTWVWMKEKVELPAKWIDLKVIARNGENVIDWFGDPSNTEHNENVGLNINETGAGIYNVTVTFNGSTVTATAEKQPTATIYFVNTGDWDADNIKVWVWDANNGDNNYTGGTFPGQKMTATGEQIEGKDVYSWSTYELNPTPTNIIISNNGDDYARTGDQPFVNGATYRPNGSIASVTKSISAAGYATYCSPYALDFSSTGLTAYIAKKDEQDANKIVFTTVTKIPASTGVLLKGNAGNYTISTTETTDDVTGNVFKGVLEDTQVDPDIFVLMNRDEGVGFYKTTQTFTVGANTAYIPATDGARTFIGLDFDNASADAQGIDGVATVKANSGEIFNLQGQRVSTAKKGLYIVNGKKVVMK